MILARHRARDAIHVYECIDVIGNYCAIHAGVQILHGM
jgi:hypothetical protein